MLISWDFMGLLGLSKVMGIPLAGWFISCKNLIKIIYMDENWGYAHFRKPPYEYVRYVRHSM
jgi:hypothetical protein